MKTEIEIVNLLKKCQKQYDAAIDAGDNKAATFAAGKCIVLECVLN